MNPQAPVIDDVLKFSDILGKLPDTADPADEIDFIRSHPAMARKAGLEPGMSVGITGEDILTAPSKSAAIQLRHHANNPKDFFKQVLIEHRKREARTDSENERYVDMPLREVRMYLDQIKARKNAGQGKG